MVFISSGKGVVIAHRLSPQQSVFAKTCATLLFELVKLALIRHLY
jgi:hypothetical protein